MGDEQKQLHLFQLPEEMIENISRYLDLIDLKNLSLTCHYFNEVCGKRLGKHFKISLPRVLNHRDFKTFENSKRKYENFKVYYCCNKGDLEGILKQVQSLPSIDIKYIHFYDLGYCTCQRLNGLVDLLKRNAPALKEICATMTFRDEIIIENYKEMLTNIKTITDAYKLSLDLGIMKSSPSSSASINFSQINKDFNYPTKISLTTKIDVDHMIDNVKYISLSIEGAISELKWFRELGKLEIYRGVNDMIHVLISNNRDTLKHLQLNYIDISNFGESFELPCQLKTFECVPASRHSSIPTTFLVSQSNLRSVTLKCIKLTNNLLEILSNQKMLSTLCLTSCSFEDSLDLEKLEFIKNVLEINLNGDVGLSIVETIFKYADKVEKLSVGHFSFLNEFDNQVDDNITRKLLSNLKTLKIYERKPSEFTLSRIEAPNLEKCSTDCKPNLLYECKRLKSLKIERKLNPKDIQSILKKIPSLEVFELKIDDKHFEKTLKYVLRNINNILHFRLLSCGSVSFDKILEYKNMISETLNNLEIFFLERTPDASHSLKIEYNTEKFSFEIMFNQF